MKLPYENLVSKLNKKLAIAQDERDKMQTDLTQYEQMVEKLKAKIKKLKEDTSKTELKAKVIELQEKLDAAIENHRLDNENMLYNMKKLKEKNQSDMDRLKEKIEELLREISDLSKELRKAQELAETG